MAESFLQARGSVPWGPIPPPPTASVLGSLPLSVFYHFLAGIRSLQSSLGMFEWDSDWDDWGNHRSHWTKIHVFIHLFMEVCSVRRKGKITKKPLLLESEVLGFSFFSVEVLTSTVSTSLLYSLYPLGSFLASSPPDLSSRISKSFTCALSELYSNISYPIIL